TGRLRSRCHSCLHPRLDVVGLARVQGHTPPESGHPHAAARPRCCVNQSRAGALDRSKSLTYASKCPPSRRTSFFGSRALAWPPRAPPRTAKGPPAATTIISGVGLTHSIYAPGSYAVNISTDCKVTSFRHAGARVLPVSVNHCQESGVASAHGAIESWATTGIIAGALPA